jgi:subtilisin family serine protease
MRKLCLISSVVLLLSSSLFAAQHIVRFENGVPADFEARVAALGGRVVTQHPIMAVVDGLADANALALSGGIVEVRNDVEVTLEAPFLGETEAAFDEPFSPTNPTTAVRYPRQWHLRAIGAQHAWAAGRVGSPSVTVAILDSGIGYTHPDLAGLVDLSRSVSFQPGEDAFIAANFPGKHPVTDLHYHGTHVAATIASNALAAAGVTSKLTLIGVKVLAVTPSGSASGSLSAVLNGVLWAADKDADVANMSLGSTWAKAGNGDYVGLINSVFNYANNQGMLIVVSAGNSAIDMDHDGNQFKAYCSAPNVVCVSATGPTNNSLTGPWANVDALAPYSNYGRSSISVAAPGGNASSVWAACSPTSIVIPVCQTGTFIVGLGGTSMAAPHVSGLAGLVREDVGDERPSQIKVRIQKGADDLGEKGTDAAYGKGRINVPRTLGLQ